MRIATLLHPQVRHAHDVTAVSLGPEQVAISLKHAHDVVVINVLRQRVSGKLAAAAGLAVPVRRVRQHRFITEASRLAVSCATEKQQLYNMSTSNTCVLIAACVGALTHPQLLARH